jgi:hypothetical protein
VWVCVLVWLFVARLCLGQVKHGTSSTSLHVWLPGTEPRLERWNAFKPRSDDATTSIPTAEWEPADPTSSLLWRAEEPGAAQLLQVPGRRYWARVAPFTWRGFATLVDAEAAVARAGAGAAPSRT